MALLCVLLTLVGTSSLVGANAGLTPPAASAAPHGGVVGAPRSPDVARPPTTEAAGGEAYVPYGPVPRPNLPLDALDGGASAPAVSPAAPHVLTGGSFLLYANPSRPSGPVPLTVGFTPFSPTTSFTAGSTYTVAYGDGDSAAGSWNGCNPVYGSQYGRCPAFEHTYVTPGTYSVDITITNSTGAVGSATATVAAYASAEAASWTNLTGTTGLAPSPRDGAAVAYDPVAQEVVLFGGWSGSYHGDTWVFQGGSWSNITSTLVRSPSPRYGALMAWDATDEEIVLVGGYNVTSGGNVANDTWTFSGSAWTPAPQAPAYLDGNNEMTNDTQLGGVILTGEMSTTSTGAGTEPRTLHFVGGQWSHTTFGDPGAQWDPEANDASDGYVLTLGGNGSYDAFELQSSGWDTASLGTEPTWDGWQTMVDEYGDDASTMATDLLLSMVPWSYPIQAPQEWSYFGGSWTNLTSLASTCPCPGARFGPAMAYDPAQGGVLVFGGEKPSVDAYLGDTWTFGTPSTFQSNLVDSPVNTTPDHGAVTFQTSTIGANGVISYQYTGLPPGCSSQDVAVLSCTPMATGTYTVVVFANTSSGQHAAPSEAVLYVEGGLYAEAAATPTQGTSPLSVAFTATAYGGTGVYTSYAWHFGDGGTSSAQDPAHTYVSPGTYDAWVNVTDSSGTQVTSNTLLITVSAVGGPLTAVATATPTSGTVPLTVSFNGTAMGGTPPYTWWWSAGPVSPGWNSHAENPVHQFITTGSYNITLEVNGSVGQALTWVWVAVHGSNASLTATATATPTSGTAPLTVSFSGTASGGLAPYTFLWQFGDGATATSADASHTYVNVGSYTATLTVTDARGATATTALTVSVVQSGSPLAVSLSATPISGVAPLQVFLQASPSGGSAPYSGYFKFGDGSSSPIEFSAYHNYTVAGVFTATYFVTDSTGATANATITITVGSGCPGCRLQATAQASPDHVEVGSPVTFWANGTGGDPPYVASWSFGDGANATGTIAFHTYSAPGTYNATVELFDASGAESVAWVYVTVVACTGSCSSYVPPELALLPSPAQGAAPLTVELKSTISGGEAPYDLVTCFGDGTPCLTATGITESSVVIDHTYEDAGTYSAVASVTDARGNSAQATTEVVVSGPTALSASTAESPESGVAPLTVTFWAAVSGGSAPYNLTWAYGDGSQASGEDLVEVNYTYLTAGQFSPLLTVRDSAGHTLTVSLPKVNVSAPATLHSSAASMTETTAVAVGLGLLAAAVGGVWVATTLRSRRRRQDSVEQQGRQLVAEMERDARGPPPAPPAAPPTILP